MSETPNTWSIDARQAIDAGVAHQTDLQYKINDLIQQRDNLLATQEGLSIELGRCREQSLMFQQTINSLREEIAALKAKIRELTPLKPALRGLVTTDPGYVKDNIPYANFASWKPKLRDLYPSRGVVNWEPIYRILNMYPNLMFRPRIMAGTHSPDWMKARSGGAIEHVPNTSTGAKGWVPRFWTPEYYEDYMWFMARFAEEFEDNPQVVEIPNSLTTTIYAEPFILNADVATVTRYWNAGYRWEGVRDNLMNSMYEMMRLFPTTRISLAGHGKWERILDGTGKINYDWPSLRWAFNTLIDAYGPHLVIDDHGLDDRDAWDATGQPRETATNWYSYMSGLKSSELTYGWQFTMKEGSSKLRAAQMGVEMGARFLEFAGFNDISEPTRQALHDACIANGEHAD